LEDVESILEVPKDTNLGDYALPCFSFAKKMRKSPVEIAKDLAHKINSKELDKVEAVGPYVNFFVNTADIAKEVMSRVFKEKENYGSSKEGKGKTVVIDMSSPNIAKPFGIGHLRSTIIGNSVSKILEFSGFKVVKVNYLGDWGTPFGKIIAGYKEFGKESSLKKDPVKHLFEIYVKASAETRFEDLGREWFRKMESGDKEAIGLWKKFRELSIKEFNRIYEMLGVTFDVISGESEYNGKMESTLNQLEKKGLLKESEGAWIVDLKKFGLGVCLMKKSDGATLYATRDITAALDRHTNYKSDILVYEVGAEQKFYFRQLFKILELMGYKWAVNCKHVDHGLYLDSDGKKFATRKGKTVFMEDILNETKDLAKAEIKKRGNISEKELESRAMAITSAAIFYGDLKNYRGHDMIFDIDRFVSFEGDTGPYLLYSYARAQSILEKAGYKRAKKVDAGELTEHERSLVIALGAMPGVVRSAQKEFAPNLVAHYAYNLAQTFNEFYHKSKVIGDEREKFRLALVDAFSQVLANSLSLLGINVIDTM
jgi:arginyl-tRNA synthetase